MRAVKRRTVGNVFKRYKKTMPLKGHKGDNPNNGLYGKYTKVAYIYALFV